MFSKRRINEFSADHSGFFAIVPVQHLIYLVGLTGCTCELSVASKASVLRSTIRFSLLSSPLKLANRPSCFEFFFMPSHLPFQIFSRVLFSNLIPWTFRQMGLRLQYLTRDVSFLCLFISFDCAFFESHFLGNCFSDWGHPVLIQNFAKW